MRCRGGQDGRAFRAMLMDHRTRELLVRQRTFAGQRDLRAHMAEFGVVARVGLRRR